MELNIAIDRAQRDEQLVEENLWKGWLKGVMNEMNIKLNTKKSDKKIKKRKLKELENDREVTL